MQCALEAGHTRRRSTLAAVEDESSDTSRDTSTREASAAEPGLVRTIAGGGASVAHGVVPLA